MLGNWTRQRVVVRRLLGRRRRVPRMRPGDAPGTLVTPETPAPVRIRLMHYTNEAVTEADDESLDGCLAALDRPGVTWINVDGLGRPELLAALGERLGFHPLSVEDVVNVPQRPKVEGHPNYLLVVLRMLRLAEELREEQVSLFLGDRYVVTVQERADWDVFEPVRERIRAGRGRIRSAGADHLAYALVDAVVDGCFPVLEGLGERLDGLEDQAVLKGGEPVLGRIQSLRHDFLTLRRAIWPMRDAVAGLLREESRLVTAETRTYLRDCHDHAVQALDIVETDRETTAALMEIYLASQNQRLNEVMKVLTVIATLFIPLTFIASIYGMNFQHMPELGWRYGYAMALGLMALVAAGLLAYFRRRGWW
jgi:magnesium transporter